MALTQHHADTVEFENANVESTNAQLRRRVKAALQQKVLDLIDLICYLVFIESKAEALEVYGQGMASLQPAIEDTTGTTPVMRGGGGGMARKFISKFKDKYLDESGKVDLGAATAGYNSEKSLPQSDLLDEIRDSARRGTLACREAFKAYGRKRAGPLSSFGTLRQSQAAQAEQADTVRLMLCDMQRAISLTPVESSLDIVAVSGQQNAVLDVVRNHFAGDLAAQQRAIKRVSRLHSVEEAKATRQADAVLAQSLCAPVTICPEIDMSGLELPMSGALRKLPGPNSTLVWTDHSIDSAACQVSQFRRHRNSSIAPEVLKAFERKHVLISQSSQRAITLPKDFQPTRCYTSGFDRCLCAGRGILLDMIKTRFAAMLCRLCPPKTLLRSWLHDGWLVACLPEDGLFLHIAIMYFKPRRPTVVMLEDNGRTRWGKLALDVQFETTGEMRVLVDTHLFASLNFSGPKTVTLLKLCSFPRMVGKFAPAENLLVDNIGEQHLSQYGDTGQFWAGDEIELNKLEEAKRRKAAHEKKLRELRKGNGEQPAKRQKGRRTGKHENPATRRPPADAPNADPLPIGDKQDLEDLFFDGGSDGDDEGFGEFNMEKFFASDVEGDMDNAILFGGGPPGGLPDNDENVDDLFDSDSSDDLFRKAQPADGPLHASKGSKSSLPPAGVDAEASPMALSPSYTPTSGCRTPLADSSGYVSEASAHGPGPVSDAGSLGELTHISGLSDITTPRSSALFGPDDPDIVGHKSDSSSTSTASSEPDDQSSEDRPDRLLMTFGPFVLRRVYLESEYVGIRIECRKHHNAHGTPGCDLHCQRSIMFGVKHILEDDAILRCKRWALWGYTIPHDHAQGRKTHFAKAPRSFSRPLGPDVLSRIPDVFPEGSLDGL